MMRSFTVSFLFVLLFLSSFAQHDPHLPYSQFIVPIEDKSSLKILDKVEDRIEELARSEKYQPLSPPYITAYAWFADGWIIPLTKAEVDNILLPGRKRDNSSEIYITWNTKMDTGFVLGCSRRYANNLSTRPRFMTDLPGLQSHLNKEDFSSLKKFIVNSCANKFLLSKTSDSTFLCVRELNMEELNILPQFQPMTLFRTMESLQWLIMSSDPQLSKLYTHSEVMHLQTIIDTVYVEDLSSGRMVAVPIKLMSSPVSLLLVEKWEIIGGKNTNAFANVPPILGFKRTITGIGMRYDSGKPLYMPYDKVREQFKKNSINEDALEQLIHAHLTKALDICYYERW